MHYPSYTEYPELHSEHFPVISSHFKQFVTTVEQDLHDTQGGE